MNWFRWEGQRLHLLLHVQPGARQNSIADLHGDRLKIKIHAPAVDGKANAALLNFIAECFGASKTDITILQGETGRLKALRIARVSRIPPELQVRGLMLR